MEGSSVGQGAIGDRAGAMSLGRIDEAESFLEREIGGVVAARWNELERRGGLRGPAGIEGGGKGLVGRLEGVLWRWWAFDEDGTVGVVGIIGVFEVVEDRLDLGAGCEGGIARDSSLSFCASSSFGVTENMDANVDAVNNEYKKDLASFADVEDDDNGDSVGKDTEEDDGRNSPIAGSGGQLEQKKCRGREAS